MKCLDKKAAIAHLNSSISSIDTQLSLLRSSTTGNFSHKIGNVVAMEEGIKLRLNAILEWLDGYKDHTE